MPSWQLKASKYKKYPYKGPVPEYRKKRRYQSKGVGIKEKYNWDVNVSGLLNGSTGTLKIASGAVPLLLNNLGNLSGSIPIGRRNLMTSVHLRGLLWMPPGTGTGQIQPVICRLMLIYDMCTTYSAGAAVAPNYIDILATYNGTNYSCASLANLDNGRRFKVLADEKHVLQQFGTTPIAVTPQGVFIDRYVKCRLEFRGSVEGGSYITAGALYLFAFAENFEVTAPTFQTAMCRIRYVPLV